MEGIVNLADYRRNAERRWLEKQLLISDRPHESKKLLADAFDLLRQNVRDVAHIEKTLEYADRYLREEFISGYVWLAKGSMELMLGKEAGFLSLNHGVQSHTIDPFKLCFARYAITRSSFPTDMQEKEIAVINDIFAEKQP